MADLSRLSFNQITAPQMTMREAIQGCQQLEIGWIGVWRDKLAEFGVDRTTSLLSDCNVRVSSLLRGGFFPATTRQERRERLDDNQRAVEEAAAIGTDVLVLVCGPSPNRDLEAARAMVTEGLEQLAPFAAENGVRLGIEPLHPMMVAERSVVATLRQALDLAELFSADQAGVVIDAYHVWWDPELDTQIARASGRILGYHVSDWTIPTTDILAGRGFMGDGVIDLPRIGALVEAAGYDGPIEVEVINSSNAESTGADLLRLLHERFATHV